MTKRININKDIEKFAEITNEQSMRIMITETFKECINDSLDETFIHNRYKDSRTQINMLQSYVGIMVPKSAFCQKNSELENFFCKNVIDEYGVMDKIDYVVPDNIS